jgi:stearoyl-CoA desaturase (delta-9 desaturase)
MARTFDLAPDEKIDWLRTLPFWIFHLVPLAAIYTGVPWYSWLICLFLYYARVFFITGGYHRYFSHRSYSMGRVMQFLMALGGTSSFQRGVLWWAAHHRHHHKHSDQPEDVHSPKRGFMWSHMQWFLAKKHFDVQWDLIPDFRDNPELKWLNKHEFIPGTVLMAAVFFAGYAIEAFVYNNPNAWMSAAGVMLIGFVLSTILLWHGTFTVNSLAHVFGSRRFATRDTSRNNLLIALLTGGEGWHNNHHHYQAAARQGFYWYEVDMTYYILKGLSKVGLVRNLRQPPERVLNKHLIKHGTADMGMFHAQWERAVKALSTMQFKTAEQKKALEDLLANTRGKIEEIAKMSSEKAEELLAKAQPEPEPVA